MGFLHTHFISNVASFNQQPGTKRALLLLFSVCGCLTTCRSTAEEGRRLTKTAVERKIKLTGAGEVETECVFVCEGRQEQMRGERIKGLHARNETFMGIGKRKRMCCVDKHSNRVLDMFHFTLNHTRSGTNDVTAVVQRLTGCSRVRRVPSPVCSRCVANK